MKLAALTLVLSLSAAVSGAPARVGPSLAEVDRARIIRSILLRTEFLDEGERSKTVHLSTEHIPPRLLKEMPVVAGVKFVLLTPDEISDRAKTGLEYYAFSGFEVTGRVLRISFYKEYLVSGTGFASASGTRYEYRRERGRWRLKIRSVVMSMS